MRTPTLRLYAATRVHSHETYNDCLTCCAAMRRRGPRGIFRLGTVRVATLHALASNRDGQTVCSHSWTLVSPAASHIWTLVSIASIKWLVTAAAALGRPLELPCRSDISFGLSAAPTIAWPSVPSSATHKVRLFWMRDFCRLTQVSTRSSDASDSRPHVLRCDSARAMRHMSISSSRFIYTTMENTCYPRFSDRCRLREAVKLWSRGFDGDPRNLPGDNPCKACQIVLRRHPFHEANATISAHDCRRLQTAFSPSRLSLSPPSTFRALMWWNSTTSIHRTP